MMLLNILLLLLGNNIITKLPSATHIKPGVNILTYTSENDNTKFYTLLCKDSSYYYFSFTSSSIFDRESTNDLENIIKNPTSHELVRKDYFFFSEIQEHDDSVVLLKPILIDTYHVSNEKIILENGQNFLEFTVNQNDTELFIPPTNGVIDTVETNGITIYKAYHNDIFTSHDEYTFWFLDGFWIVQYMFKNSSYTLTKINQHNIYNIKIE